MTRLTDDVANTLVGVGAPNMEWGWDEAAAVEAATSDERRWKSDMNGFGRFIMDPGGGGNEADTDEAIVDTGVGWWGMNEGLDELDADADDE